MQKEREKIVKINYSEYFCGSIFDKANILNLKNNL